MKIIEIITEAGRIRRGLDRIGARAGIAARTAKSSAEQGAERMRRAATDLTGRAKDINRPPGLDDPVDLGRRRFNRNAAIAAAAAAAPPPLQGAMTRPMTTATLAGANPIKSAALNASFRNLKNLLSRRYVPVSSNKHMESEGLLRNLRYMNRTYGLGLDIEDPDYNDSDGLQEIVKNALKQFNASEKIRSYITPEGRPYVVMENSPGQFVPGQFDEIYLNGETYRLPQKEKFRNYTIVIQRQPVDLEDPEPVEIISDFSKLSKQYEIIDLLAAEGTDAISAEDEEINDTLDSFVEQVVEQGFVVDWSNPENWIDAYVTNDPSKLKQTGARSVMRQRTWTVHPEDEDEDETVSPVFQNIVGELISQLAGRKIKSMLDQPRSRDSRSDVDDMRTMKDRMDQLDALPAPGQDSEQELADQLTAELQQQLNRDLTAQEEEYVANEVEKYSQ